MTKNELLHLIVKFYFTSFFFNCSSNVVFMNYLKVTFCILYMLKIKRFKLEKIFLFITLKKKIKEMKYIF